jgi:hypothetical protein
LRDFSNISLTRGHLSEVAERRQTRCVGGVFVWNSRETEMVDAVEIDALFFAPSTQKLSCFTKKPLPASHNNIPVSRNLSSFGY